MPEEKKNEEIKETTKEMKQGNPNTRFIFHKIEFDTTTGMIHVRVKGDIRTNHKGDELSSYRLNIPVGKQGIHTLEDIDLNLNLYSFPEGIRQSVYETITKIGEFATNHLGFLIAQWDLSCKEIIEKANKEEKNEKAGH